MDGDPDARILFQRGRRFGLRRPDGWVDRRRQHAGTVSATATPSTLAAWPEANRNPLLSVALPPGQSTTDTAGALTVGMRGTALHYDAATSSWQVDATPARTHHINLNGVAFAGPSLAFAVGQAGVILRWDGASGRRTRSRSTRQRIPSTRSPSAPMARGGRSAGWARSSTTTETAGRRSRSTARIPVRTSRRLPSQGKPCTRSHRETS